MQIKHIFISVSLQKPPQKERAAVLEEEGRYPIQQLLSDSADTKVKMYTTLLAKEGKQSIKRALNQVGCILESVDAGIQAPLRIEDAL